MIRSLLNWIFNHIKERPTDEQLIAYGRQLEREAQYQPPAVRQRGYAQSAWNSEPERHTDPRQVQGIRQRAAIREVYPKSGDYVQHVNEIERKRFVAQKLSLPTEILPTMPHKAHMQRYDGPPLPDETLYSTPAFLTDRKIS